MDRYLYKAKRLDNGEWVQGVPFKVEGKWVLLINDNENLLRVHYIEENMWTAEIYAIEVDASTICRCTGLKDKNGKLIWEKDIIRCKLGKVIVLWDEAQWKVKKCDEVFIWYKDLYFWVSDRNAEVIGNIFDNKELLESEG